ncbi:hypothetical protein [Methanopyrus sp.]
MIKRILPCTVLATMICIVAGLQPAHSEKAPVPKPPKLEKEEKKEKEEEKERKESTLKPGKYRVAKADIRKGVVYLKPLYKPKPTIPVKVPQQVIRQLRPGTVVEVHQRGNSTVIRTASRTAEGSTVTTHTGPSASSSGTLQTRSTSSSTPSTPSRSAGAGTYWVTTVKAGEKTVPSEGGKTAGSSKSEESKDKKEKKEKERSSKEKMKVKGPKSSGSSDLELQREARSENSSGWAPYLVAIALVGAATGGMWLVKQRRSMTWEWE